LVIAKLESIRKKEITAEENVKQFLAKIKKDKFNAILFVNENAIEEAKGVDKKIKKGKAGKLAGLAIVVKSCISVTSLPITCASKTLEDYKGTFDADVIKKIRAEGGVVIAMANMDEFASGASGTHGAWGATKNPVNPAYITGGSSSGSAASVAADYCDLALGTDTGGSIRTPASYCGVVGVKPSYGRVSRFGLLDLGMSFDQISPLSKTVEGSALLLSVMAGHSKYDATTFDEKVPDYTKFKNVKGLKIGLSPDFEKLCTNKILYKKIKEKVEAFASKNNCKVVSVNLKNVDLAVATYYPIVYTEFYSATRKYDGRKYGKVIEDSCGEEVLRRILGGKEISKAEFAGQYYRKALAAKKLIADDLNKAFEKVDVLITPVTPVMPLKLKEKLSPETEYAMDAFTVPANLAGICAGSVPGGTLNDLPFGIQVLAPAFKEELLFSVMKGFEDL